MGIGDKSLRLFILGDSKSAEEAMARTSAAADATSKAVSDAGSKGGTAFSNHMDDATKKTGGMFERLGSSLSNWGLPFGNSISKIGEKLKETETKGQRFAQMMSSLGGATLAVGGAAFLAVGAESVHMADQFDTAQAALETAIKNSGSSWGDYKGKVDAAYSSMANLGFENTDVANSLQVLTTATNAPSKAIGDMALAANIARMRHESLTEASGQLAKVLGGNTRLLAQWGINLDIGSGKLHSIQSAHLALISAQLSLKNTESQVSTGQMVGAKAAGALATAHLGLAKATLNYQQSEKAIPDILAALTQRTHGAASAFGKTLPGQMDVAKSHLHNLGVEFGGYLTGEIHHAEAALLDVADWMKKNKTAAETLGIAIGTVLGGAVALFAVNKAAQFVKGIASMSQGIGKLATTVLTKTGVINAAGKEEAAQSAQSAAVIESSQASIDAAWTTTNAAVDSIAAEQEATYTALGLKAQATAGEIVAAMTEIDVAAGGVGAAAEAGAGLFEIGMADMELAAESGAVGIDTAIGSTGIGLIVIGLGIAISEVATHWSTVWPVMEKATQHAANAIIDFINPVLVAFEHFVNSIIDVADILPGVNIKKLNAHGLGRITVGGPIEGTQNNLAGLQARGIDEGEHKRGDAFNYRMPKLPGSTIPSLKELEKKYGLGGGGGAGPSSTSATGSPLQSSGQSMLQTFQAAISSGTAGSLRSALTGAMNQKMDTLVSELDGTHNKALESLAGQLVAVHRQALAALNMALETNEQTALADQTQLLATELAGMTTIMNDMAAKVVAGITDSATASTNLASAVAQHMADKAQTESDILGERGLYGLNLVAQQQKVALDKMTTKWDSTVAGDQANVDKLTEKGNSAIQVDQKRLDLVTAAANNAVQLAQNRVDLAAGESQAAQNEAASALKSAQARASLQEAQASASLAHATDASSTVIARANQTLAQAQDQAKVAEAQQQAAIAIWQAKASSQYAGSGLTVNISGINPTDSAAVAQSVGWHMRTKVAV